MAWPSSFDNFPANHVDPPAAGSPEKIAAAFMNRLELAVNALQQEFGLNPSDVYADVATRLATLEYFQITTVSTPTYQLSAADVSKILICTAGGGCAITIPPSSTVNFKVGTAMTIRASATAGSVTLVGGAGVTIYNPYGQFALFGPSAEAKLMKTGTDIWALNGEVFVP